MRLFRQLIAFPPFRFGSVPIRALRSTSARSVPPCYSAGAVSYNRATISAKIASVDADQFSFRLTSATGLPRLIAASVWMIFAFPSGSYLWRGWKVNNPGSTVADRRRFIAGNHRAVRQSLFGRSRFQFQFWIGDLGADQLPCL